MSYQVFGNPAFKYGNTSRLYGSGASSDTVTYWTIEVDWDNAGTYSGTSEGLYCIGLDTDRGRRNRISIDSNGNSSGFEPMKIGSATITLDNSTRRYDPYNTSSPLYPNVLPGRYIRIRETYLGVTSPVIHGTIKSIKCFENNNSTPTAVIEIEESGRFLQSAYASIIPETTANYAAIQDVLNDVSWPSIFGTNLDTDAGFAGIAYFWADNNALTLIREVAEAHLGDFFIAASGAATFYGRLHDPATTLTLDSSDFIKDIYVANPLDVIRNVVRVYSQPINIPALSQVIWKLVDTPLIANGDTLTIWCPYTYNNIAVAATIIVGPGPSFNFNTLPDGTGTDKSSAGDSDIVFTDYGTKGLIEVTNTSGGDFYIVTMTLSGSPLEQQSGSYTERTDTASIAQYGRRLFTINNKWIQRTDQSKEFSDWLITYMPDQKRFLTLSIDARPDIQFSADLFDIINLTIPTLGINAVDYRIVGIQNKWLNENGQYVRTTWTVEPSPGPAPV